MSKRMTSETVIFDTDWLTETDFDVVVGQDDVMAVSIDYQAYDTLKIIVESQLQEDLNIVIGGLFQEVDVYKIENQEIAYRDILLDENGRIELGITVDEGYASLDFYLTKHIWEGVIKGLGSIYIKGVKR